MDEETIPRLYGVAMGLAKGIDNKWHLTRELFCSRLKRELIYYYLDTYHVNLVSRSKIFKDKYSKEEQILEKIISQVADETHNNEYDSELVNLLSHAIMSSIRAENILKECVTVVENIEKICDELEQNS